METELDATLGYQKGDVQTDNKRNSHSTKNLRTNRGNPQSMPPETAMGSLSQN